MKPRNPVVRSNIAAPKRNAGRHTDKRRLAERADRIDSKWYFDWCERDGSDEELEVFVKEHGDEDQDQ